MTYFFACSYLDVDVELTDEREQHIMQVHPGTIPEYLQQMAETLANPDQIRQSNRDESALLFSKWFDTIRTGRYFVVVTVSQTEPKRHWVITAYTARKITGGKVLWKKT
ncbi:hypothetical protein [Limnoraphis robusta]|uniref:Phage-Barnase-EndoU-ColicinE5/D-RelE like nuclease 2 domain-containing protein n=1 Tax=Limnoraphis robusta CCNP1315 TaxID=3110306 RepID=A0ABU5TU99_9CYAN|nr:hypothetical protein [Limnoraphis robusta]MEA5518480.1 hypothetical protein [Limnoraphis robusta CCNP1315]MEA5545268.1 hypothetical protein [Limnoraphis robusta CCNP1324]